MGVLIFAPFPSSQSLKLWRTPSILVYLTWSTNEEVQKVFILVQRVFVLVQGVFVLVQGVFVLVQGVFGLVQGTSF